ncbi:MAG: UvrD-helicase domain-containing protein [Rubrivivax sp.]|nr:UvrD-helicase domain-containing protein [Rubrivivax sp.]
MSAPAYGIDGAPVSGEAFYAVACDPQRNVVVEACAGAGKTWMLVSRILRALLAGAEPQHILAITFTRKAAGEMRSRLDEWLVAFSEARCDEAKRVLALRERGLSPAEALAAAPVLGRLHEQLLRGGRSVEVRTFHGWFAQLLAYAPLSLLEGLGLPAAYEPIEDPTILRDELLRRLHRRVQADAALRADYLALVARHRRATVLQWLEAAWKRGPELARADAAGHTEGAVPDAGALWPECAGLAEPAELLRRAPLAGEIDALARQFGALGKAKTDTAARGLRAALEAADAATAFALAQGALFTDAGAPRKQLGDSVLQLAVVDALARIHTQRVQQQAHDDHGAMLRLSRVLLAEYAELKRRRGLVDMADLERAAEAMLGDSVLAGWVQERLDQRVRHVFIDEFQDTSPLQWQVLRGWLSSYAGAGGGASGQRPPSVFIVGDPKQSIYRFRGAEPRVFAAARDFVVQGLEGRLLQCDHTRRNAPAVIEALNAVFEDAARADGWGPFRAHTTGSGQAGAVWCLPGVARLPKGKAAPVEAVWRDSLTQPRDEPDLQRRAEEAAQAAAAVAELIARHGLQPGEIMVLARQRAALARVAEALARQGVPHVVAEPLLLHESPEALDLAAVLDVLASPGHDLALARALRSPLFGAGDEELLWLSRAERGVRGWLAALLAAPTLPTPALVRAQGLLARWAAAAMTLPPHDLLDRIVDEGDLLPRLVTAVPPARRAAALQAVNALLGAALSQQGGRFSSVYGFVRELRAGRLRAAAGAPAAAVQLLTVHGAKGLEARAVVVVDADPEPRPAQRATLLIDWPVDQAVPAAVAFLRSESEVPPSLAGLWAVEEAAREREELNGLYVAMSRAREWLVFSRTEPSRTAGGRPWWSRVETHARPWAPTPRAPGHACGPEAMAEVPVLPALTMLARSTAAPAVHDTQATRLGQAVHRLLEWAGRPGAPLVAGEMHAAAAAAAAAFGLPPAAAGRVQQWAEQVLASPACAQFFAGPALRWAGTEVPVAAAGQPLRIDRLVALDKGAGRCWWVLDYKLQEAPAAVAAYRDQLAAYVAAVQALQPGDEVRGAFITGQGGLVEI